MRLVDKGIDGSGLYPLGDRHRDQRHGPLASIGVFDNSVVAVPSGEKRKPLKGEWYLSGAKVAAYQAKADLDTEYYIANIVKIERVVHYNIVADLEN